MLAYATSMVVRLGSKGGDNHALLGGSDTPTMPFYILPLDPQLYYTASNHKSRFTPWIRHSTLVSKFRPNIAASSI